MRALTPGTDHGVRVSLNPLKVTAAAAEEASGPGSDFDDLLATTAAHLVALARGTGEVESQQTFVLQVLRELTRRPARGLTLGEIADALRGKRKPDYTPHIDVGDFVVVVNAEKISVTGNKRAEKRYYRHSGYPGGLRSRTLDDMLERRPEEVLRLAVKGMLPRNRLGRAQLRKLKVYAGPEHPHAAQKPEPMEVDA